MKAKSKQPPCDHNIQLLKEMPESLASVDLEFESKTVILGFAGPGTILDPEKDKVGFVDITDGTSNTILCVEAKPDHAIEWTKPADLPFDPNADVTQLRSVNGKFTFAMCDGSVKAVADDLAPADLKILIQRDDRKKAPDLR
jgi:hypothetical protein